MGVGFRALQCERDRCCNTMLWSVVAAPLVLAASAQDDQVLQDDPCLAKTKVVGDVQYCDATGSVSLVSRSCTTAPTGWYGWARTRASQTGVITRGGTPTSATIRTWPIRHRALSTATGSTASLATRLPARATGPAGTAQQPSSSALVGCCTTRRPTPATGPRMWPAARSILCARMTQTAMCPLASPATDTGRARVDPRVCSVAPPCLCSTRTAGAA